MTSRQLPYLLGSALLAGGVLLAVLAVIHHYAIETSVYFVDDLGNVVSYDQGRDVTFLLFSLAAATASVGGLLLIGGRRMSQ